MNKKTKDLIIIVLLVVALLLIGYGVYRYFNDDKQSNNEEKELTKEEVIEKALEKIKVSADMNGYTLSYRLSGIYNDKRIIDDARIENYMNKDYKIMQSTLTNIEENISESKTYYIIGTEKYIEKEMMKYEKTEDSIVYTDVSTYLKGLESYTNLNREEKEIVAYEEYQKYSFVTKKDVMKNIMKYTTIGEIDFNQDIQSTVLIDKDNKIYKIEYDLKKALSLETDFRMSLYYFGYNTSRTYDINSLLNNE